jgi:hypothetical protein
MTRDELLIFNAFAWLQDSVDDAAAQEEIGGFLAAMEHREDARKTFVDSIVESTDKGEQLTFTITGNIN